MSDSVRIDCGLCGDLAPLAADGVACEQSRKAVLEHMAACPACRGKYAALLNGEGAQWAANAGADEAEKDDARIIGRVRERVSGWMLAGIMLSLILGVLIAAMSEKGLYLIPLIFPAICGAVYLRGSRLWKRVPLMAMAVWVIVTLVVSGSGRLSEVPLAFTLALIPLGLSYVGALAAALLKYAFKGEF